jgi:hypothetical protein
MATALNIKDHLITLLDHEEDFEIPKRQAPWKKLYANFFEEQNNQYNNEYDAYIREEECIIDDINDITFIFRNHKIKDKQIKQFIRFCIKKQLFNDTFYDYGNEFSIVATKLPDTFFNISKGNETISERRFKYIFNKKIKYNGNINYIYFQFDPDQNGHIVWDDFRDFFLQFIKNITM